MDIKKDKTSKIHCNFFFQNFDFFIELLKTEITEKQNFAMVIRHKI